MAIFSHDAFELHDDYMTPKYAWDDIKEYIPRDKVIWEAFYGDGKSGKYLEELGFNVIHQKVDFFKNNLGDIIVSNPPFSKAKEVIERLVLLDKPFILILPSSKINTQYIRNIFIGLDDKLQIIIPKKRIQFVKLVNGKVPENFRDSCNFDCFYYCYKLGLESDLMWLK